MSEARSKSQAQTAPRIFGYKLAHISVARLLSVKFFLQGRLETVVALEFSELEFLTEQIDSALADGQNIFTAPNGRRFEIPANLMRSLRADFRGYGICGGSDAHVAGEGRTGIEGALPLRDAALRPPLSPSASVKKCGNEPKASSPAVCGEIQGGGASPFIDKQRGRSVESGQIPAVSAAENSSDDADCNASAARPQTARRPSPQIKTRGMRTASPAFSRRLA